MYTCIALLPVCTRVLHYYQNVHVYCTTTTRMYMCIAPLPVRTRVLHYYRYVHMYCTTTGMYTCIALLPECTRVMHYYRYVHVYCYAMVRAIDIYALLCILLCSPMLCNSPRMHCDKTGFGLHKHG